MLTTVIGYQTTICSYTVRRTQYDRLSQQQLSFLHYTGAARNLFSAWWFPSFDFIKSGWNLQTSGIFFTAGILCGDIPGVLAEGVFIIILRQHRSG